ncbi:hypothetical protein ACFSCW_14885 [Sphingomonas tabacisoli]|uniref:Uncharacterized protein n=1 Tax=Sphingomonas tabacisoli TaxID=2249466 RepID=A0ABW4I550_9SPHN
MRTTDDPESYVATLPYRVYRSPPGEMDERRYEAERAVRQLRQLMQLPIDPFER